MKLKQIAASICFAAAMLLFTTVNAQQKQLPPASERAAKLTEWMKTNLALTADQEPKVQDINLKYAGKLDELQKSTQPRREKMKTLKENDASKDAELKQVLTDEQFKTYQAKKDELKEKVKQKAKTRRENG